jgi:D-glycero-D-manno-heptose 1,7-bisphosphate phosphatase
MKIQRDAAIFLDKDGTLIQDIPYNIDPSRIEWMPGALAGLKQLQSVGYRLIVVSNQSGVARGFFPEVALQAVAAELHQRFAQANLVLTGFYYCPHHPEGVIETYRKDCTCRKPAPGLILQAAADHHIDLQRSWMIGDILHDIEAGKRAGCQTVLLDNGHETEWNLSPLRSPQMIASTLKDAAQKICAVSLLSL